MTLTGSILITGGSGTLGSAIVRTAEKEGWDCSFTIYSRSELRQAEMRARYPKLRYILGDVRDYDRLAAAVAGHDLVIHAAAVKRIPEAEQQPLNCIETNVGGSVNVVRACIAGGVKRCIGVSTDKACASLTTYGASKRMLEGVFQHAPHGPTAFTLVRYGNVVASNGSVIPLWRQQASEGRPITITDRRMTRFWMSERDAVRIIQQAYVVVDRAIVVPKMGALGIEEMAQIIAPGCDMVETGLRSTEKLHEDLVHPFEAAKDKGAGYLLMEGGELGHRYTSDIAPRLTREAFLVMLKRPTMLEINLFDSNFVGQACSVATQTPTLMRYVRGQMHWPGITVFTDGHMYSPVVDDVESRFKIGWLHEGRCLHPENYEQIGSVAHKFDAVMTHDAALLQSNPASITHSGRWRRIHSGFVGTIRGGSWVPLPQWGMYPKSKNVAMILSEKTQLEGHRLRHAIADASLPIDLFGPGHTPIGTDKSLAYRDYRFAVVVEACREENFFSEHLIDAIAYGCVPIYWGCPNIADYFPGGFLQLESAANLFDLLTWPLEQTYLDIAEDLYRDQQLARAYAITEDWQIEHCLRPFVEAL